MVEVPVFPSLVAVIVAVPAATPVTRPFASTVAAAVLLEAQVTARPVRTLLLASFIVAVSCCVVPARMLADAGFTVTVATDATVVNTGPPCQSSNVALLPYTPTPGAPLDSPASVTLPIATPFL
jgi:hypothetical protein